MKSLIFDSKTTIIKMTFMVEDIMGYYSKPDKL